MLARLLTIVGAGREGWVVLRRGHEKTVCARGASRTLLGGRSTSPLEATIVTSTLIVRSARSKRLDVRLFLNCLPLRGGQDETAHCWMRCVDNGLLVRCVHGFSGHAQAHLGRRSSKDAGRCSCEDSTPMREGRESRLG